MSSLRFLDRVTQEQVVDSEFPRKSRVRGSTRAASTLLIEVSLAHNLINRRHLASHPGGNYAKQKVRSLCSVFAVSSRLLSDFHSIGPIDFDASGHRH